MSKVLQLRRGTTAQNDSFTGAVGEVTVDTTKKTLRLHDGSTKGGKEIIGKSDLATVATSGSYADLSNKPTIDSALSASSTNAVQNKVVNTALATKLALAGGTMTGTLTVAQGKNSIDGANATGLIQINANGNSGGGQIRLHGKSHTTNAGEVIIYVNNGTDSEKSLVLKPNGTMTWCGSNVVTASKVDSALSTTSTNPVQNKVINSALASKVNTSALAKVATSGSYNDLLNKPTISSGITVVAESYTSSGWYRKYSDGWIEQGIAITVSASASSTAVTKSINFLTAFSSAIWWYTIDFVITNLGSGQGYKRTGRLSFSNYWETTEETSYGATGTYSLSNTAVSLTYKRPSGVDQGASVSGVTSYFVVWGK